MNNSFLLGCILALTILSGIWSEVVGQKIKSAPFTFAANTSGDQYHQRIPKKTFAVGGSDFVILSRKSDKEYAVERYGSDLKIKWSASLNLLGSETVEAFSENGRTALVITHRVAADQSSQALYGRQIDLETGKELQVKKLQEAPSKSRRLGISFSEDGSKLVTYHSITKNEQLRSMQAQVYDASLTLLKDRAYDFNKYLGQVAAQVKIDNRGDQYVSLLTESSMRLSVRRYNNRDNEIKVMEVMVGGVFNDKKIYVRDARFEVTQDSSLYAAVLVAEEKSGQYRSLKVVKFDFAINNMRFAEEFKFTPEFIQRATKTSGGTRLEDIYLSDILVSAESRAVVLIEKRYTEGGESSPYHAQEILLFGYDEYLNPTWNSVILKNQIAPATEGFAGISYRARLFGDRLQLLTLETLNGKTDLFSRSIQLSSGNSEPAQAVGLNVANDKQVAYVKDFSTWLDERTIVTVSRPSKASAGLRLSKITFKE